MELESYMCKIVFLYRQSCIDISCYVAVKSSETCFIKISISVNSCELCDFFLNEHKHFFVCDNFKGMTLKEVSMLIVILKLEELGTTLSSSYYPNCDYQTTKEWNVTNFQILFCIMSYIYPVDPNLSESQTT